MRLQDERRTFEDFAVGTTYRTAGRTITEADLVSFVNATGMIGELFTNAELARSISPVGARPVPGLLVLAFAEALNAQGAIRGSGLALLGLDVAFSAPVSVGDTVHAEVEVIEARVSGSRPGAGIVRFQHTVLTADGRTVVRYGASRMIQRRQATGDAQ